MGKRRNGGGRILECRLLFDSQSGQQSLWNNFENILKPTSKIGQTKMATAVTGEMWRGRRGKEEEEEDEVLFTEREKRRHW